MGRGSNKGARSILLGKKTAALMTPAVSKMSFEDGAQVWRNKKGQLHREDDLPAAINPDGSEEWWKNGERWRVDGKPHVVRLDGTEEWWNDMGLHRIGAPAVARKDGSEEWLENGEYHRADDLPAKTNSDGSQEWFIQGIPGRTGEGPHRITTEGNYEWLDAQGRYHRKDSPAVVYRDETGAVEYWENGEPHREEGPAFIGPGKREIWYTNGKISRGGNEPAVTERNGTQKWMMNGEYYRGDGGPHLVTSKGTQKWFLDTEETLHRLNGPALIHPDGREEYWVEGKLKDSLEEVQRKTCAYSQIDYNIGILYKKEL